MARGTNYYTLLGVDPRAGPKEIKAAYHRLARRYHPDVNPGNVAAEELLKQINAAYEVLSDPEKRARYNRLEFGDWVNDPWQNRAATGPARPRQQAQSTTSAARPRYSVEEMNQFVFRHMRQGMGREKVVRELHKWAGIDWLQAVGFVRYAEIIYRCEITRRRRALTWLAFYGSLGLASFLFNMGLRILILNSSFFWDGPGFIIAFINSIVFWVSIFGFVRSLGMMR